MNAHKVIAAEEILAVTASTAGELLAQGVNRGFPSPRRLISIFAFFGILGWVSGLGQQAARVAAAVGGLVTLLLLLSPAGQALTAMIANLSAFGETPPGTKPAPPPGQSAAPSASGGGGLSGLPGKIGGFFENQIPFGSQIAGGIGSAATSAGGFFSRIFGGPSGPPPTRTGTFQQK